MNSVVKVEKSSSSRVAGGKKEADKSSSERIKDSKKDADKSSSSKKAVKSSSKIVKSKDSKINDNDDKNFFRANSITVLQVFQVTSNDQHPFEIISR